MKDVFVCARQKHTLMSNLSSKNVDHVNISRNLSNAHLYETILRLVNVEILYVHVIYIFEFVCFYVDMLVMLDGIHKKTLM